MVTLSSTSKKSKVQRFAAMPPWCVVPAGSLTPCIEGRLCLTEDLVDGVAGVELVVDLRCIAFIGQRKLVFQIDKAIVDRSGGEHQHLRAHARANNAD